MKLIRHQENGANDGHNLTCMQDGAASPEARVARLLPLTLTGRPDPSTPPLLEGRAGWGDETAKTRRPRHPAFVGHAILTGRRRSVGEDQSRDALITLDVRMTRSKGFLPEKKIPG